MKDSCHLQHVCHARRPAKTPEDIGLRGIACRMQATEIVTVLVKFQR